MWNNNEGLTVQLTEQLYNKSVKLSTLFPDNMNSLEFTFPTVFNGMDTSIG